ncbi:Calvin cycle CP12, partial [Micractinium conductrix]
MQACNVRVSVTRPAVARAAARPSRAARLVVRMSAPKKEDIEAAIKEAQETCEGGPGGECAAAWDTVEELSAAASHAKASSASKDPLEDARVKDCETDPSQPECRVAAARTCSVDDDAADGGVWLQQLVQLLGAKMLPKQTAVVECPKSMVGRVIGKGGETIKSLQQYTGAMIQIDQSTDPTRVTIAGSPQSLQLAVSMVNDIVRGTFKGFAMLRQIALSTSQPGMPGFGQPQPVYVQGYGFVPPSQQGAGGMQGNMGAPGGSQGSGRASPATALAAANPALTTRRPLSDTGSPLGRYGAVGSPSSQGAGSIGAASIAARGALAAKMASAAISPGAGPTSMQ